MVSRSFLDDLRTAFPKAFQLCCECDASMSAAQQTLPCAEISSLWSRCFRQHATNRQIVTFLVEKMGMFGIFGNLLRDDFPNELLEVDERLSWAINNADRWKPPPNIRQALASAPL